MLYMMYVRRGYAEMIGVNLGMATFWTTLFFFNLPACTNNDTCILYNTDMNGRVCGAL